MTVRNTIEAIYNAYRERDLEKTISLVSDDFCWTTAIDEGDAPYGGVCRGHGDMGQRMNTLAETFEYLEVNLEELLVDGDRAAARLLFKLKPWSGGEPFHLTACHFWRVADGKGVELTEVYDTGIMAKNMG